MIFMNYGVLKKILLIIIVSSSIVIVFSCQSSQTSEEISEKGKLEYQKKAIEVKAQLVKSGTFNKEIMSNGILIPCQKAKLVFKVNENISKVFVKNGQEVKNNQVLLKLEEYNQKLNLEKAKNQLLKSEIELKDILFAHSPDLSDTSKINPKVLETARGRSGYKDALIAVQEAEYNLSQTVIKAPFLGVISDIQVKENNYSGNYKFFANIFDVRQMELEFGIMESELEMVSQNASVIIIPYAFPNKKFKGKISEINPSVDKSGMIKVKAIIPNPEGVLLDGMNVEVLVKKKIPGQLIVPKEAVLLRQNRQMLFTLKNDSIAQWVYVKTGFENTSEYTITEGVSKNDTIIISNNFNLGHEVIVKAQIITK